MVNSEESMRDVSEFSDSDIVKNISSSDASSSDSLSSDASSSDSSSESSDKSSSDTSSNNTLSSSSIGRSRNYSYKLRWFTVIVSFILSISVAFSYILFDIYDIIPGPLTIKSVNRVNPIEREDSFLSVSSVSSQAEAGSSIDKDSAQSLIKSLVEDAGVGNDVSVVIEDFHGNVVATHNPDIPREPASTLKTLTAAVASHTLDMGSTLDTFVYALNAKASKIVLKGNGDMLLGAGENDINHVNGRAGLATLAKNTAIALKNRGISSVHLSVDDSLFGEKRYPPLVHENNEGNYYYEPTSSMAIDCGRKRNFNYWLSLGHDADDLDDYPPLDQNQPKKVAETFVDLLSKQGISVDFSGEISKSKSLITTNAFPIAHVSSATLSEILGYMLRRSDNSLAEEFGRLTALAKGESNSPEGAVKSVVEGLKKLGVNTEGLHMSDCSGLSPKSSLRVTTLAQVQLLNLRAGKGSAAAQGLALPGFIGSARRLLKDESALGMIRVKTGSLDKVTSLTGNVTRKKGGTLVFAVVVNNPKSHGMSFAAISKFMSALPNL